MEVTLNGLTNPSNIVTFTHTPTILSVGENTSSQSRAKLVITLNSLTSLTQGQDYYISINNHKINAVWDISKAVNNNFYVSTFNDALILQSTAVNITNALRNVSYLATNYDIYVPISASGALENKVVLYAKEAGSKSNISFNTNLPSSSYSVSNSTGTTSNTMAAGNTNQVKIDVYQPATTKIGSNSSTISDGSYVTTLVKNYTGGYVSFDLSPLFNSQTPEGELTMFNLMIYAISDGKIVANSYIKNIYSVNGYLVNQGGAFIPSFSDLFLAANVSRGETKTTLNNTVLYVYEPEIRFSLYSTSNITSTTITIKYLNSAFETINTTTQQISLPTSLTAVIVPLNAIYRQSHYIDIVIPNLGTLRYNVIQPLSATAETQRIYWYNSYGGVSFWDFTGDRTEERETELSFYQSGTYDFYAKQWREREKVYDKDVVVNVTLTTHNIVKDGTYSLFDLQNSVTAYTIVNGVYYVINITDIKITETSVAGIYKGEITYTYSLGDTF